jgi:uncharacterized coiled-coil protein SlyX
MYKRSNKQGNIIDLINMRKISAINVRITDNIAKVKVTLDSGVLVHSNMTIDESSDLLNLMVEKNKSLSEMMNEDSPDEMIDKLLKGKEDKKKKEKVD